MENLPTSFANDNYVNEIDDTRDRAENGFLTHNSTTNEDAVNKNVEKDLQGSTPDGNVLEVKSDRQDSDGGNKFEEIAPLPTTITEKDNSSANGFQPLLASKHQLADNNDRSSDIVSLPVLDLNKEFDFDDILRLINPFGKWQLILCLIAPLFGAWPYVLLPAFIAIKVPHYCRVPTLDNTTWTPEQIRNLSIPLKSVDSPPAIGQSYQPCRYYGLPYEELIQFSSFEEAYAKRLEVMSEANDVLPILPCNNGWNYDTDAVQYKSSVQIDFDMVCEREPLLQLSLSSYMIGMLVGVIIFGAFSDRFGRRKGALVSGFLALPVLIAISLSTSNLWYTISRFLFALLLNGHFICMYVLVMEIVGPQYRASVGFWQNIPFYIGYSLLAPMAYWLRDSWRLLHAVQSWPLIMLPVFYFLLPESPRWLITQGRYWEARVILEDAARLNGEWPLPVTLGPDLLRRCRRHLARASTRRIRTELTESGKEKTGTNRRPALTKESSFLGRATKNGLMSGAMCFQLLKTPELRQRTVLSCFLWFSICAVYYGLAFYSVKLDGDIFVNFFLMGIVALPAYALSWLAYQRVGRKPPLIAVLLLCGIFCCAIAAIDWQGKFHDWHVAVLICATAGKFFMTGAFGMVYVYSAEIFPTVVRNVGISSNSMVARLGSAFAPYVNDISDILWHPLPMLIYGVLSLFTAITTLLLPETHNVDLSETIEEVEEERRLRHRASSVKSRQEQQEQQQQSSNV